MLALPSGLRRHRLHLPTCLLLGIVLGRAADAQCTLTVPPHVPGGTEITNAIASLGATCPGGPWTLNLSASTYNELVVIPPNIEVAINGAMPFGSTVLDGTGLFGPVVTLSGGQSNATVLQNFMIVNGTAFQGGGMLVMADSRPVLRNLNISSCTATDGGGLFIDATLSALPFQVLRVSRVIFKANHADGQGGAIEVVGAGGGLSGPTTPADDVLIRLCEFKVNTAGVPSSGGGLGGAIDLHGGAVVHVDHSMLLQNTADVSGGAIAATESGRLKVTECVFDGNRATGLAAFVDYGGGAVFVSFASFISVEDSQFNLNRADSTVPPFFTAHGGHVLVLNGPDGPASTYLFRNNLFFQGRAAAGGGMSVYTDAPTDVLLCTFSANNAQQGGAIFSGASFSNLCPRIVDSIAFLDIGAQASPFTGSFEIFTPFVVPAVSFSDIQHPGAPATYPGATLNVLPGWVSGYVCPYAPNANFFLASTSPCVDAGDPLSVYPQIAAGFSTAINGAPDINRVNLGYHHLPTTCP